MPLAAERVLSFVSLSLVCLFSASSAGAAVYRDRAAFESASQNLHTIDFESVALTPEPFAVNTPYERNLSLDGRTRVTLLVAGVNLNAQGEESFVTARAVDAQQRVYDLPVEGVGAAKNLTWLAQVTVRLPAELSGAGDLSVSITVRGVDSNKATLRVN